MDRDGAVVFGFDDSVCQELLVQEFLQVDANWLAFFFDRNADLTMQSQL